MLTTISMYAALVMLAAVVVAKLVTMEMLAAHNRRYSRLQEQLEGARHELRVARRRHAGAELEWKAVEHRRHRVNTRMAHAHEEIGLYEYDDSCRQAHFELLTMNLVER